MDKMGRAVYSKHMSLLQTPSNYTVTNKKVQEMWQSERPCVMSNKKSRLPYTTFDDEGEPIMDIPEIISGKHDPQPKQPPVESLDSILEEAIKLWEGQGRSEEQKYALRNFQTGAWNTARQNINRLIQTSNRDVVLRQGVHHAAEMSILDQEIMSLKAEIKRLKEDK